MTFLRLITILLFLHPTIGYTESTTFDSKPLCLKQGGNWRKFPTGCVDRCEPIFNPLAFCTEAITFGCDCGENSCLYQNKCIKKKEYQKIYDEKQKKENEELEKLRKERLEKFNNDPKYSYKLHHLYHIPQQPVGENNKNPNPRVVGAGVNQPIQNQQQQIQPPTQPRIRQIPPAFRQRTINSQPINSNGQAQDLVFPVIPVPQSQQNQ